MLIKFDIEGAEGKIFDGFEKINKVKNLVGEVHLDLMDMTKEDFLKKFNEFRIDVKTVSNKRFLLKALK